MRFLEATRILLGIMMWVCSPWYQAPSLGAQEGTVASEGMIAYRSDTVFAATMERVEPTVRARGLFVMRVLDHAAGAARFDQVMSPNSGPVSIYPRSFSCGKRMERSSWPTTTHNT
jgi:hypothetical protein